MLQDPGCSVSVSIVDTGFSSIPQYARLLTDNPSSTHFHGNRVLSVFTAPDQKYPLSGLSLNLAATGINPGYEELIYSIKSLPKSDILSLSMCWRRPNAELLSAILEKADTIVVPCEGEGLPYPARHRLENAIVCCDDLSKQANYCIRPRAIYSGSSYAVPAIARLLCYSKTLGNISGNGPKSVSVLDLFAGKVASTQSASVQVLHCPFCHCTLKHRSSAPMSSMPENCPYCGMQLK